MNGEWHIASLVVRCRPERMAEVGAAIGALPDTEVRAAQGGRLAVVIEAPGTGGIADRVGAIRELPGVLAADPVYHHAEPAAEVAHGNDAT